DFSLSDGTSGMEKSVIDKIMEYISDFDVSEDENGNLFAEIKGNDKTILLDAHCDRIGLVVTAIEDGGFLRVAKCGGMDARVLAAQDVIIHGKKDIYGVITSTPPHLSTAENAKKAVDFDDMLVDTGFDKEELEKIISLGDRITVKTPVQKLLNNRISGAALDNRAGCAAIIKAAQLVDETENHPTVKLMFSAQEETGGYGAVTGSSNVEADESICVDVSFAKAPDMPNDKCGKLDGGAMIGISPLLNYDISMKLKNIAEKNNIPYSMEIMSESTGTNADHISVTKGGIKSGLVSIPLRNMHTGVEIISISDVENCAKLIAEYIIGGGLDA
ncbi:MAG: M42 family peptidase, partial [Ruminococcus sp.]|nr:M42 family peptidase [Candidatus Copronaster equi]